MKKVSNLINRKKHKVFLGGTCNKTSWRDELIPLLKIDYFNPMVKEWTDECQAEEERQKNKECDIQLYVITPSINGVFSIAEVTEAAINIHEKCVFCILDYDEFNRYYQKSLKAVENLLKKYGAKICTDINDIADYLNSFV